MGNTFSFTMYEVHPLELKQIIIIHDLDACLLGRSIEALGEIASTDRVSTLHLDEFLGLTERASISLATKILVLHLDLRDEIKNHELISRHAELLGLELINPYNRVTEIFDNKYKFYQFMIANGLEQLKTKEIISTAEALKIIQKFTSTSASKNFILKATHGTESRDQFYLSENWLNNLQHIETELTGYLKQVLDYDSIVLQEFLDNAETRKILIYQEQIVNKSINGQEKKLIQEFISELKENHDELPKIFSLDLLCSESKTIILEANSRPAAIYKYL
ncbi:MAG: hypothetical protein HRT47_06600 [Candidatus Caenarcaniphilales bacterium]|nr:hypothetical protein [Candidatus Caenarcaniphilales bacterium]